MDGKRERRLRGIRLDTVKLDNMMVVVVERKGEGGE